MPRSPDPLPSQLDEVFTAAAAARLGVHARRLGRPDVTRLLRGVYAREAGRAPLPEPRPAGGPHPSCPPHPAEHWRRRQRELASLLAPLLPARMFFARRTAAAIWHLSVPMPRDLRDARVMGGDALSAAGGLDVACVLPSPRLRAAGLNATRVAPGYARVVEHHGLRVTDPASTWAMMAPLLSRDDLVALGDAVIRRPRIPGTDRLERPPHAGIAELEELAAMPYRRGALLLRETASLLSPHAASPPESHLRLRISDWRLPAPQLDHDVYSSGGLLLGCSELAYPRFKLALEYEGDHHRVDPAQWHRDIEKYRDYRREGWEVLQVTRNDLYHESNRLRSTLESTLRSRGWDG